jgi:hypothetical protein
VQEEKERSATTPDVMKVDVAVPDEAIGESDLTREAGRCYG